MHQDSWMVTTWCPNLPVTSKLNELLGTDVTACGNSFLCNLDGKAKESDGGKCPLPHLATYVFDKRSWCLG